MKKTEQKIIEWFLRVSISAGLLSAVADRFGMWPKEMSAWGSWQPFVAYTGKLNPLFPADLVPVLAYGATFLEIFFGIALLIPYKTSLFSKGCGLLFVIFGVSMVFALGIKAPLDYSVFVAAGASFALSILSKKVISV